MPAQTGVGGSSNYLGELLIVVRRSGSQLVRPPLHSRRSQAIRLLARRALVVGGIGAAVIVALMFTFDATEIAMMPPRGTPSLWPLRILTDFGKDTYVLWSLGASLMVLALVAPALQGNSRALLLAFGTRLQFLFFAVLIPVLVTELVKWVAGRGRPFVGGKANPFNFAPFTGTEAYLSFPSGHAVTSAALAFAVGAIWPRARPVMYGYAAVILCTRLVLLAHHPSDVLAGALVGVLGVMVVRYWFAVRRLGFAIRSDGKIVPRAGHPLSRSKRVARGPVAP